MSAEQIMCQDAEQMMCQDAKSLRNTEQHFYQLLYIFIFMTLSAGL